MGQYYYVCNLTKREYLHPHALGDGLKLREFGFRGGGTMSALAVLLAVGNGRGGGDLDAKGEHADQVGRWAGDRVAVLGDYADPMLLEPRSAREALSTIARLAADGDGRRGFDAIAAIAREALGEPELVQPHDEASGWRNVSRQLRQLLRDSGAWDAGRDDYVYDEGERP